MENADEIYNAIKEARDLLKDTTMTGRVMKAAKRVIETKLDGDVLSIDAEGYRILAEIEGNVYVFFVDWDSEGFPDPEISKEDFERALCDFEDAFLDSGIENASIIPGHIALWVHTDRAFVRITKGVDLR